MTNIRLSHEILPDFTIWPPVQHCVEDIPAGGRDIVVPALVPGEQITVSYLYFPPMTVENVNKGIKHDGGFARPIPVLLQRQYPRWVNAASALLLLMGAIFSAYLLYRVGLWAYVKVY